MSLIGGWTGAGSPDTMSVVYDDSSCQGTGHVIVAPSRRPVRLALPNRRRARPPLCPTPAAAPPRRPVRRGRRTVTSWFRAAGVTDAFRPAYNALWAAGRHAPALAYRLLGCALLPLMRLAPCDHLLFAIDDTPTPRYGPCVQAAGVHHNPSPGPAGEKYVYGHVWVTLACLARHPRWHTLSLPLQALLYIRQGRGQAGQGVPLGIPHQVGVGRRTVPLAEAVAGPRRQGTVGGGRRRLRQAALPAAGPALGLVVFSRLRKDADLRGLPPTERRRGQRGPLPTYGKERIGLAKRAGQKRGWRPVECVQYGKRVTKTIKTFQATWRPAGGRLRVVLVQEQDGWLPFFCTDPAATAEEILEAMADRSAMSRRSRMSRRSGARASSRCATSTRIGALLQPDPVQRGGGVGLVAWGRGVGGPQPLALGCGGAAAVACRQTQGAATRDPPRRNPGDYGRAGQAAGVSAPRHASARSGRLIIGFSRKVQKVAKWCRMESGMGVSTKTSVSGWSDADHGYGGSHRSQAVPADCPF